MKIILFRISFLFENLLASSLISPQLIKDESKQEENF